MYRPHVALTGILLGAVLVSGGCAKDTPATAPPADEDTSVGHIHGLGVDPADDSLYVATHFGLFHVDESGRPSRVADRYQDTMAFTVAVPMRCVQEAGKRMKKRKENEEKEMTIISPWIEYTSCSKG